MEKKSVPPLPPKASAINEKSKSSPSSSKNMMTELEENIRPKPLQPVVKKRYSLIFAKILFTVKSRVLTHLVLKPMQASSDCL